MTGAEWAIAFTVLAVGAAIQGSIGFGLNLLAAPIVVILEPATVPGPLLITALGATVAVAFRERASLELRGLGWALTGRVPGVFAGTWAVATLSQLGLELTLGIVVLGATIASAAGWHVARTPATELSAGLVSGFTGTTTSIGGPPMALLYQHEGGQRLRANMSGFLLFGVTLSIVVLAISGELGGDDVWLGIRLLPPVAVGLLASKRLAPVLDQGYTRRLVLLASGVGATALLAHALVG